MKIQRKFAKPDGSTVKIVGEWFEGINSKDSSLENYVLVRHPGEKNWNPFKPSTQPGPGVDTPEMRWFRAEKLKLNSELVDHCRYNKPLNHCEPFKLYD